MYLSLIKFLEMKILRIFFLLFGVSAFAQEPKQVTVSVDTILKENISIRAILLDENKIWYAANEGRLGFFDFDDNTTFEKRIVFDTIKPEFRSIAKTSNHILVAGIGSPALFCQIDKIKYKPKLIYRETHKKVFYDSMQFWNDKEGIAIGDPTEDCFSILITRDGGSTWTKLLCSDLPKIVDGEAAFASSNTNVILKGNKVWLVSGGKKARVFYSPHKGKSWQVFETPIVQGKTMTGIFSADFFDENIGIIAGGDYENPERNSKNKAITYDGGKTWNLIAENNGFGYASCVQFVPGGKGKEIVSVGASGLQYSSDGGLSWQMLLEDKTLYTIRFQDANTAFAAGKNKIIRIRFKK
jgi:hypothetical protein